MFGRNVFAVLTVAMLASSALAQDSDGASDEGFVTDNQVTEAAPEPVQEAEPAQDSGWAYDWSGSYIGINGGYGLGHQNTVDIANIVSGDEMLSGHVMGGYMGTNHQMTRLVIGTETDFSVGKIGGPFQIAGSAWACGTAAMGCKTEVQWFGSWRARAGIALNSFLPYATAGVAIGGVDSVFTGAVVNERVTGFGYGYVVGGGLEYAVMKNLTIRAEALHYALSDVKEAIGASEIAVDTSFNVVRAGVDVKF
jgi:outer membrane immunogenic protein